MCSSDVKQSPTCFGLSQFLSSGSPLSRHHSVLEVVHCAVNELTTSYIFTTSATDHFENVIMATETFPDDRTCDVSKHVGDWLTYDEHILCKQIWLRELSSIQCTVPITFRIFILGFK